MKSWSESRAGRWLTPLAASALLAIAVVALVIKAGESPLVADAVHQGFDWLAIHDRNTPPSNDIVIVDFDDAAIAEYKAFPVPRKHVAEAVRKVASGGAELIGLDFLLTEARTPEEDKDLAAALSEAGNVIIAAQMPMAQLPATEPLPIFCDPDPADPSFCKPGGAFGRAYINLKVDNDGFVRRTFLLPPKDLPIAPVATALATNSKQQPLGHTADRKPMFLGKEIPVDDLNTFLIGTWSLKPVRTIPALAVLAPGFDASVFKGKLVIIGSSSAAGR
ncbi:MAG TPA: CHASE2 domain-containing protein, partial [Terriglobales bacterium]